MKINNHWRKKKCIKIFRFLASCGFQSGLKDKWMEEVLEEARREIRGEIKNEMETQDEDTVIEATTDLRQALSLDHLQGAFWILFLGHLVALFSFLIENGKGRIRVEA